MTFAMDLKNDAMLSFMAYNNIDGSTLFSNCFIFKSTAASLYPGKWILLLISFQQPSNSDPLCTMASFGGFQVLYLYTENVLRFNLVFGNYFFRSCWWLWRSRCLKEETCWWTSDRRRRAPSIRSCKRDSNSSDNGFVSTEKQFVY